VRCDSNKYIALEKRKEEMTGEKKKYKCEACRSTFSSEAAFKAHLTSKKHIKKDTKQSNAPSRAGSAPPSPSLAPTSASSARASSIPTLVDAKTPASPVVGDGKDVVVMDASDDKEGEEDGEGEDDGEVPAGSVPVGTCLFCQGHPVTFKNVDACVEHMLKHHGMLSSPPLCIAYIAVIHVSLLLSSCYTGFFVPFVEYLKDLEGLLGYLGIKIGHAHECLYCNGRGRQSYPTLHAVREHMVGAFVPHQTHSCMYTIDWLIDCQESL
jgi:pre-60S factor REI1